LLRPPPSQRPAAEPDLARRTGDDAHDRVQRGRLAGAVRADQPDDLAPPHREREVAHGRDRPVAELDPVDGEQRLRLGHSSSWTALSPRYAAVTSRFARTSAGVPSASVRPWSSTWIRSHTSMISAMLWSIRSTPAPWSSRTLRTTAANSGTSASGSPAAGSSISTNRGSG